MFGLVSIVLPVYNGEKYLRETIDSILNQSYENFELIVIDDGSNDNSLQILKEYEKRDSRIRLICQNNMGISFAMKVGVGVARGKYIFRSDHDDISHPERIEKQLRYLIENNYDMVGCYYKSFGSGSEMIKYSVENFVNRPIRNYKDQYIRYCNGVCIYGGSICARADVLRDVDPFKKEYVCMEDAYIYVALHKAGYRIGIVPEVLYYYRVHNSNTSLNLSKRRTLYPQYYDVLFNEWYRDRLLKYKKAVVIKRKEEEEIIRESFSKFYEGYDVRFVDEEEFEEFFSGEVFEYSCEECVFFVGGMFFNRMRDVLEEAGFEMYENLFMVIDCYF